MINKPFKETLNLPKTDFPMRTSPAKEAELLKTLPKYSDNPYNPYVIHDGPPFANGDIHLGHVLNKTLKDVDLRVHNELNFSSKMIPGWDCHGLPIENHVKKSPNMSDNLKENCAKVASYWSEKQSEQFQRFGVWADWEHPYKTMNPEYETAVLNVYKALQDKGLIYQEKRPVHWSVENRTALAMGELEYKTIKQTSVYVLFDTLNKEKLAIWTTTPWTLPANVAVAVNPELNYVLVDFKENSDKIWIAEDLIAKLTLGSEVPRTPRIIKKCKGKDIIGMAYELPLSTESELWKSTHKKGDGTAFGLIRSYGKIVGADFVTNKSGTGLVHIAPAHGMEDYKLGKKENLSMYSPLKTDATFDETATPEIVGMKVWEANDKIIDILRKTGHLFHTEEIEHEYPHDDRSGKPTITLATEQIFVALDKPFDNGLSLRERAIAALDKVEFIPPEGKNKLIKMINDRPDWCISRQRTWGIGIPNTKDIFDVWFESGSSWTQLPATNFPADVYLEGSDQFRGWFQHSLLLSVAILGVAPFKKVVSHCFIVKPDGTKVSKSDKEYVKAIDTCNKLGSDVMRLWICSNDFRKDICASPKLLEEFSNKYDKIRNTLKYLASNLYDFNGKTFSVRPDSLNGWILYKTMHLVKDVNEAYLNYDYHIAFQKLLNFCTVEFSAVYANAMKDRLYCGGNTIERKTAQSVMAEIYSVLVSLLKPMIPITVAEVCSYVCFVNRGKISVASSDTWEVLLKLRDEGLMQLNDMKMNNGLNKALDAEAVFYFKEPEKFDNYGVDLEDLLGVGHHTVWKSSENSVKIVDRREVYPVCERCWKRRPDIGFHKKYPTLSKRDAEVVWEKDLV